MMWRLRGRKLGCSSDSSISCVTLGRSCNVSGPQGLPGVGEGIRASGWIIPESPSAQCACTTMVKSTGCGVGCLPPPMGQHLTSVSLSSHFNS
jgi:hypothetical protein